MVDLPFPRVSPPAAPDAAVRPARPSDAPDVAAVQVAAWRQRYAEVLPEASLDRSAQEAIAAHWSESLSSAPPSPHAAFVATAGRIVVGYAVTGPADDEGTGEVTDLEVHPDATRLGHGSRLLAAAVEHLRDQGSIAVALWSGVDDTARLRFLESAGLAADGVRRRLDMGEGTDGVDELRLSARLD